MRPARHVPKFVPWFFLAMGLVPAIVLVTLVLRHALRRWQVRASAAELRVEQHGLSRRTTVMPADEIEELHVGESPAIVAIERFAGGGPPIVAITDRAQVRFANSLPRAENDYIVALLRGALSAPARR